MTDQKRSRSPSTLQYDRPLSTLPETEICMCGPRYTRLNEETKDSLLEMYAIIS